MCVFFSSNCVKSTTFSILHNFSRADVIALTIGISQKFCNSTTPVDIFNGKI